VRLGEVAALLGGRLYDGTTEDTQRMERNQDGFWDKVKKQIQSAEEALRKVVQPDMSKKPTRIRENQSSTADKSSWLEQRMVNEIYDGTSTYDAGYAPDYAVPWGGDENMITFRTSNGVYRATPNVLDSLAKYAGPNWADIPIVDAMGLSAHESLFGKVPLYNSGSKTNLFNSTELLNSDVLRNFGYLPAEGLVRDFAYTADKTPQSTPPLSHAFNYYKAGRYNPGDPNHTQTVKEIGKLVTDTPGWKAWWESEGENWYNYGSDDKD